MYSIEDIKKSPLYAIAEKWHTGQRRWEREDYINHPVRIALRTVAITGTTRYVNVALAHDLFEDTEVNKDDVLALLDEDERYALFLLTRTEETYKQYLDTLLYSKNPIAIFVKMCDALDNAWLEESDKEYITDVLKKDPMKNYRERYLGIARKCKDQLEQMKWSGAYLEKVLELYTVSPIIDHNVFVKLREEDMVRLLRKASDKVSVPVVE